MKNKELAYAYVDEYINRNAEIADSIDAEGNFEPEDKQELKNLLILLGNAFANSKNYSALVDEENQKMRNKTNSYAMDNMENTYQTIISIKTSLQEVIRDLKSAFKYVLWMYVAAFALGIALIVVSIVFAVQGKTILAIAFGSIGLIDLVTYFIFKPPLEIQNSRSNLIQLMLVVTNWFADLMNLNTYLSNKLPGITLEEVRKISDAQNENTAKMLDLIEKYGETKGK